tara:strand:- start:2001 stop:2867 length:867 start_codon:yes stop_codon:yes gene_type:complete
MKKFTFLIPVYNDWASLKILLEKIELQLKGQNDEFSIIILNDLSTLKCDISVKNFQKIKHLKIINFNKNIGSQRAIAIGLKYISQINENNEKKMIIIMDSDGQDDPEILDNIIEVNKKFPDEIITINRLKRKDPIWFKIFYELHYYSLILFSGHKIRYGHYSLISSDKLEKLFLTGDLWSAYPAAISKSFKTTYKIFHERKKRYSGNTKMNLYKLFIHSIRIFSVFKYKVLLFSSIYSLIFFFLGSHFYFLIFILIIFNFLIFLNSHNNKEKIDKTFSSIIGHIDTIL